MKKVLLTICIILVALTIMAPAPDKAEKLKVNDQDYDIEPFFYKDEVTGEYKYGADVSSIGIDCKFGLATAGEHADFKIGVTMSGVKYDNNNWDSNWSETVFTKFEKDPEDTKDEDGYIGIVLTDKVSWNGEDDGSGFVVNEVAFALMGPSDQSIGEASTIETGWVLINNPSRNPPSVMVDDEDWDYDPKFGIIVPLLAYGNIVDILQKEGYEVAVEVDVWNTDGSPAGSGRGSTDIVKVDEQDFDYVQIEPVDAALTSVEWNGDDDGTQIVSGTIEIIDSGGTVISTTKFENQPVGFVVHTPSPCEDCAPGETVP